MSESHAPVSPARWLLNIPWPLPAIAAWAAAWLVYRLVEPNLMALVAAQVPPAWLAWRTPGLTRRTWLLAGFPLSVMLHDASLWPAWLWLLPAAVLLLLYPVKAWRDAPIFPTGATALRGLAQRVPLPHDAQILDAGCGAGHALRALREQWPQARLSGIEHSWPLVILSRLRCPHSAVYRGDMWRHSWARYDLVYLFQRPETMDRAWHKARTEMRPGAWLASLEFPVPGEASEASLNGEGGRPLWLYRLRPPADAPTQSPRMTADKPVDAPASGVVV